MRAPAVSWFRVATAAAVLVCSLGSASAQTCGDPDGGGVSVTDGVNVLRAVASLPGTCDADPRLCDVDGVGGITVTDAVSVLRRAASLSATLVCADVSGMQTFIGEIQAFASLVLQLVPVQNASPGPSEACDEGSFDRQQGQFTFHACRFGDIAIDGTLTAQNDVDSFNVTVTEFHAGQPSVVSTYQGMVAEADAIVNGTIAGSSHVGTFSVALQNVDLAFVTGSDVPPSGALDIDVRGTTLTHVNTIHVTFNGTNTEAITVTFDDGATGQFTFDAGTGVLTSAG